MLMQPNLGPARKSRDPGGKMSQIDPWEKAAECVRAIQISTDPCRKDVLRNLQHMWIALAHQRDLLTQEQRAREAEKIGRLHAIFGDAGRARVQQHEAVNP
jgi:hypothetical protein